MAVPVALWLRCEVSPNDNEHNGQFDKLLGCSIDQLIETVARNRIEALADTKNSQIGYHISLLWEDPYRLPIDIDYSM